MYYYPPAIRKGTKKKELDMRKFLGMALIGAGLAAGVFADEIKLSDKFTDASNWSLNENWQLTDGQMTCSNGNGGFMLLKDNKTSGDLSIEASITPIEAKNEDWKVGGVAVVKDEANFWAFCLIESPNNEGKKHFIEVKEMKDGKWGAEANAIKIIPTANGGLNWEYNTTYRLKLVLNSEGITGTVSDKSGKVLAEIKEQFTGDVVKSGTPALRSSGLAVKFDNVEISGK
jgi:membrane protease subunit (stomatin/prohibitin family)